MEKKKKEKMSLSETKANSPYMYMNN